MKKMLAIPPSWNFRGINHMRKACREQTIPIKLNEETSSMSVLQTNFEGN